jgi:hypothetical protein
MSYDSTGMKIRATLHLEDRSFNVQLYPVLQETDDHLILKLAACVLFHRQNPVIVTSPQQHPALQGQDFAPDLIHIDPSNQVRLWIECDKTTLHKLDKVTKRFRMARILMLMAHPREAQQMMETLEKEGLTRVELWSFAEGEFKRWRSLVQDQNDIIGEATETTMNLVINGEMFVTDLIRCGA